MMLSRLPEVELKQVPSEDEARRIAADMKSKKIESLTIDVEQSKQKSVACLEHFPFLKQLCVGGHARDIETIASLKSLRELCFLRVTVPDFRFLAGLKSLKLFDMRFGGCKAFDTLAAATRLIGLNLLRLPTLTSLDFVRAMPDLQLIQLDSCKGITRLPDFSNNPKLRKLVLETMNGLVLLKGIETARGLEQLVVMEAKELPPREFEHAVRAPAIKKILAGIGLTTSARYKEAESLIPERLQMDGYYGTRNTEFTFRGYKQPAVPE
jgi:hypothetical protein